MSSPFSFSVAIILKILLISRGSDLSTFPTWMIQYWQNWLIDKFYVNHIKLTTSTKLIKLTMSTKLTKAASQQTALMKRTKGLNDEIGGWFYFRTLNKQTNNETKKEFEWKAFIISSNMVAFKCVCVYFQSYISTRRWPWFPFPAMQKSELQNVHLFCFGILFWKQTFNIWISPTLNTIFKPNI